MPRLSDPFLGSRHGRVKVPQKDSLAAVVGIVRDDVREDPAMAQFGFPTFAGDELVGMERLCGFQCGFANTIENGEVIRNGQSAPY